MQALLFLDGHRLLHWALGLGLLALEGGLTALAFLPRVRRGAWGHPLLFALLLLPCLLVLRFPSLFVPVPLNTDETLFLAEAQTYHLLPHALPWRDVDGYSGGPVGSLLLLWAPSVGLPLGYPAARLTGIVEEALFLLFVWLAGRRIGGEGAGRAAALPFLLFFSLTSHVEWIHYSSEHASLPLLGAALWLLARMDRGTTKTVGPMEAGLAGFLLGLMPLSKLQGAPPLLFLVLSFLLLAWKRKNASAAWGFLVGLGLPAAATLLFLLATGTARDFWGAYIVYAVDFAQHTPWREKIAIGLDFLGNTRIPLAVLSAVGAGAVCLALATRKRSRLALWACLFFTASFLATIAPGLAFPHYTLYLFPGFACLFIAAGRERPRLLAAWRSGTASFPGATVGTALALALGWSIILAFTGRDNAAPLSPLSTAWAVGLAGALAGATLRRERGVRLAALIVFLPLTWIHPAFRHFQFLYYAVGAVALAGELIRTPRWRLPLLFALLFLLPTACLLHYGNRYRGTLADSLAASQHPSAVVARLRETARTGDRLAVWGWAPEVAFDSGLPLGTREPETHVATLPGPRQASYRARFLRDLEANRPRFFLDSTGPANFFYPDRARYGLGSDPALAAFVAARYVPCWEGDGLTLYERATP